MKKVIAKIISLGLVLGMAGAMAACTSKKGTTVRSEEHTSELSHPTTSRMPSSA